MTAALEAALGEALARERGLVRDRAAKLDRAREMAATRDEADTAVDLAELDGITIAAKALAAGRPINDRKAAEAEAVGRQARLTAKAARVAEEKLITEAAGMAGTIAQARAAVIGTALSFYKTERDAATEAAWDALPSIAGPFAGILAADAVRRALIGDQFGFDSVAHPPASLWSGEAVVRRFLDALPARLLPENFRAGIEAEAKRLAHETLARLNKESDR